MAKQKLSKSISDEVVTAFANFDISAVIVLELCLSFIRSNFRDVCTFVFALDCARLGYQQGSRDYDEQQPLPFYVNGFPAI